MMAKSEQKEMIVEEQKVLDELISKLEKKIDYLDNRLKKILFNHRKAKEQGPEAYGVIVEGQSAKKGIFNGIDRAKQSKDELYTCRLILDCVDEDGLKEEIELKIGLTTCKGEKGEILVCDWKREICRHFLLDNCAVEYKGITNGRHGEKHKTHYTLKMKRNIKTRFSFIENVTHLYPLSMKETQEIIYDTFLNELVNRRENIEFRNIIFTIQKRQGEIIQIPYNEDIIVQGCAGSGKSMIMLHRLPILLYDNSRIINKDNIYIISPSEAYIQMAENIRQELEIKKFKMGTLNQYFDYVLKKYGISPDVYGKISYTTKVTRQHERYIYGNEMLYDIQEQIDMLISKKKFDYALGLSARGLSEKVVNRQTPDATIKNFIIMGNSIMTADDRVLREYFREIKMCLSSLKDISRKLEDRKKYIINNINNKISEQVKLIKKVNKELETDKSLGDVAKENREKIIKHARNTISNYKIDRESVEKDDAYFKMLIECSRVFEKTFVIFSDLKEKYGDNSRQEICSFINQRGLLFDCYESFIKELSVIEEKYLVYIESIVNYALKSKDLIRNLIYKEDTFLDTLYYEDLERTTIYYTKLEKEIAQKIYYKIMKKCGQVPNERREINALSFSPYVYVQILFLLKGAPNAAKERLICIDEAQGLAPQELKLIKQVNNGNVILNLYGDEKQHIEGTKGIDSWSEFKESISATPKLLMENYRNASQITDECNKRFGMHMKAINTPGSGVISISSIEEFENKMEHLFLNVQKPGLCAIIVDDIYEAKSFLWKFDAYINKIHDMTDGNHDYHRIRWNLLTVEQAKGLEFGTVVAISGRMTKNKKYITFTRALDELCIYDIPIKLSQHIIDDLENKEKKKIEYKKGNAKLREKKDKSASNIVDYSQSEVRKFFESKGLEVNDMRHKGGFLWIVGEKAKIEQYVDEACEEFGISGSYVVGKSKGFREGCYFKTKK